MNNPILMFYPGHRSNYEQSFLQGTTNLGIVFRTDRSEPNWDECVMKVENRFSRLSRDLPVRYRRSWACFDGDDESYPTKKDHRNRITGSRDNFSDHRIGSGRAT